MNVNVRATMMFVSIAIPFLKLTKGDIVVLTSNVGVTPLPGAVCYSVAKVRMLINLRQW
jgi:short-subunit dehydrogenase